MHDRPVKVLTKTITNRLDMLSRLLRDRKLTHLVPFVEELRSAMEGQDQLIQKQYDLLLSFAWEQDQTQSPFRPASTQKEFEKLYGSVEENPSEEQEGGEETP